MLGLILMIRLIAGCVHLLEGTREMLFGSVRYRLDSSESAGVRGRVLTVTKIYLPFWLPRALGARPKYTTLRFLGSGAYWVRLPDFAAADYAISNALYLLDMRLRNQ